MPEAEMKIKANDGHYNDGFVYKERKPRRNRIKTTVPTAKRLVTQVLEHKNELESSDLWKSAQTNLANFGIKRIVNYGLGSLESSFISRQQLALLLLIMDKTKAPCEGFDPVFTDLDVEVLKTVSISVTSDNVQAQQTFSEITLVYMPHCGKTLYNNIISSNWSEQHLANLVLIGNRLDMYLEKSTTTMMQNQTPMLLKALDVLESVHFTILTANDRAFNDLAWSTFDPTKVVDWSVQEAEQHSDSEFI